ncbi:hypothetical protein SDC9_118722 [bioreactor metagenome]|uniref:Uncharacterized protein n=1 Tax=bioreactor metagenome TaxID=1076179 RepID=A0A645C464_9ZZZZ
MLADDAGALRDQRVGGFCFGSRIIPRVRVDDVHVGIRNDALYAKEERGVTADHFGIRVGTDITTIRIFDRTGIHEFLELHASDDAGDVTRFKGMREGVFEVRELAQGSLVARHGDEGHFRIFGSSLLHVGLMAVAVGEDVVATLLDEVNRRIIALFIFRNVVLPDDLVVGNTGGGCASLDAFDVRRVVTGVLVVDEDHADFDSGRCGFFHCGGFGCFRCCGGFRRFGCGCGGGASHQSEHHSQDCQKSNELFHGFPPTKF